MSRSPVPSPPSPTGKHSVVGFRLLRESPRWMAAAAESAERAFLNALGAIRTCMRSVMKGMKRRIYGNHPFQPVGLDQREYANKKQQDEAVLYREPEEFGFA